VSIEERLGSELIQHMKAGTLTANICRDLVSRAVAEIDQREERRERIKLAGQLAFVSRMLDRCDERRAGGLLADARRLTASLAALSGQKGEVTK
jgi:hypothetical protein